MQLSPLNCHQGKPKSAGQRTDWMVPAQGGNSCSAHLHANKTSDFMVCLGTFGVWFDALLRIFWFLVILRGDFLFLNQRAFITAQNWWEWHPLAAALGTLGITLLSVKSRQNTSVTCPDVFGSSYIFQGGGGQVKRAQTLHMDMKWLPQLMETKSLTQSQHNPEVRTLKWKGKQCHPSMLAEGLCAANKLLGKRFTEEATQHKLPAQCCDRSG